MSTRKGLYNVETLSQYAINCHQREVANGSLDEKLPVWHHVMFAFRELHNAVEADSMGEWAKDVLGQVNSLDELEGAAYARTYLCLVKGTVEAEIAKAVIRLLILLGETIEGEPLSKDEMINAGMDGSYITEEMTLTDTLWHLIVEVCARLHCGYSYRRSALYCISYIERICDHFGIDLVKHINLRLKYNDTRSAARVLSTNNN